MSMRKLFIASLALSMIRVTLPELDLVCTARNAGHDQHQMTMGRTSGATSDFSQTSDDDRRCDMPGHAECCAAVGGCGSSAAIGNTSQRETVDVDRMRATHAPGEIPVSLVTSPDPPPPRY